MKYLFDTDHISFLQRRSGTEYINLAARIATHPPSDFAFSVISLHEQVLGANAFINRAQTSANTIRGYTILQEILQAFSIAPAEWEYACRAGTTTPFHFGETITTHLVNYNGNYTYASAPTGEYRQETVDVNFESFSPNYFGLYQMHGNVWECCLDT